MSEIKITCIVLGGGGHARVLIDCIQASEGALLYGVLDPDIALHGQDIYGVKILGDDELLPLMTKRGVTHFVVGVGSVGNTSARARLFEMGLKHSLEPLTVKHPSVICSRWASISTGAQLLPGSCVNADSEVGANSIVNTCAVIEHDCRIGAHTHVATGARLSGGVQVGAGAHIGAGATIKQSIVIGDGAVVGAGAVVVRDVEPRTTVVGVPARVLREAKGRERLRR